MVRGGIRWKTFLRGIVRHYSVGSARSGAVPSRAQNRSAEIVDHLETLPDTSLPPVFAKMRESGLLPMLAHADRETCPQGLPWEGIRTCFQDFAGKPC